MRPEISIIIVNYNAAQYLPACLDSVLAQTEPNLVEILVFDNHSKDASLNLIRQKYPQVQLITSGENLGFAKGNNLAVNQARGHFLFFLNPDTKLAPQCLETLVNLAQSQTTKDFILLPKQVAYDSDRFLSCGLAADLFGNPNSAYSPDGEKQLRPIFYADGAAFFLPQDTFDKLGMFDENHFMYMEDIDLSWKAHLMRIPLMPVKEAAVHHQVGAVAGGGLAQKRGYTTNLFRRYYAERNLLYNLLKNYSWVSLTWILPGYLVINFATGLFFFLLAQPKVSLAYGRALWWNITHLNTIRKKRNWIQSRRIVTDREVRKLMTKIPSQLFLLARSGIPRVTS